mmetsp:Transcript_20834/g.31037  ORF Transcript_20834/g.31037 Transcript_20834/m.31037 type:complete len:222 (-) Transcript_20834:197-862(-)
MGILPAIPLRAIDPMIRSRSKPFELGRIFGTETVGNKGGRIIVSGAGVGADHRAAKEASKDLVKVAEHGTSLLFTKFSHIVGIDAHTFLQTSLVVANNLQESGQIADKGGHLQRVNVLSQWCHTNHVHQPLACCIVMDKACRLANNLVKGGTHLIFSILVILIELVHHFAGIHSSVVKRLLDRIGVPQRIRTGDKDAHFVAAKQITNWINQRINDFVPGIA